MIQWLNSLNLEKGCCCCCCVVMRFFHKSAEGFVIPDLCTHVLLTAMFLNIMIFFCITFPPQGTVGLVFHTIVCFTPCHSPLIIFLFNTEFDLILDLFWTEWREAREIVTYSTQSVWMFLVGHVVHLLMACQLSRVQSYMSVEHMCWKRRYGFT